MKNKLSIAFIFAGLLLFAAGCSSRKGTAGGGSILRGGSPEKRFEAIAAAQTSWESVAVPVKFELKSPASISFSGKAYMERNRSIFISLRKIGFEVAQIYVSSDTVLLIDKFNGRHVSENISALAKGQNVEVIHLQDILMGQPFNIAGKLEASRFSFFEQGAEWMAIPKNENAPLASAFSFSNSSDAMAALATNYFTVTYSGVSVAGNLILPDRENVVVNREKLKIDAVITFSWGNAEWNNTDALRSPKKPSSGSKRIDVTSLLKKMG